MARFALDLGPSVLLAMTQCRLPFRWPHMHADARRAIGAGDSTLPIRIWVEDEYAPARCDGALVYASLTLHRADPPPLDLTVEQQYRALFVEPDSVTIEILGIAGKPGEEAIWPPALGGSRWQDREARPHAWLTEHPEAPSVAGQMLWAANYVASRYGPGSQFAPTVVRASYAHVIDGITT